MMIAAALDKARLALNATFDARAQDLSYLECSLLLSLLSRSPSSQNICEQLAERLGVQLTEDWIRTGDLTEVFATLAALCGYNCEIVSGAQLGAAVQRLLASEVAVGGPYGQAGAISPDANMHIALFVKYVAEPLPQLNAFLAAYARADTRWPQDSLYTTHAALYFLADALDSADLAHLILEQWRDDSWQTPQSLSLALKILHQKKAHIPAADLDEALTSIIDRQLPTGLWPGETFTKTASQAAKAIITTALIVSVLADFSVSTAGGDDHRKVLHKAVRRAALKVSDRYDEPLLIILRAAINSTCRNDAQFEITLLAHSFAEGLAHAAACDAELLTDLGVANLCTWISYTIYDNFLDGVETPICLPAANVAMRVAVEQYRKASPNNVIHRYVEDVFGKMDEANAWEMSNCRAEIRADELTITSLPRYASGDILATRSFAHVLGPMIIMARIQATSSQVRIVEAAFRHYLIAKQLNDDLRDWRDDVKAGQLSFVVVAILRDLRVKSGVHDLLVLLPAMERSFRHITMPKTARRILWHVDISRRSFQKSGILTDSNEIYHLLDTIAESVLHSLDCHAKTQELAEIMAPPSVLKDLSPRA